MKKHLKSLWSTSTTLRNPERALYFLKTIEEMEGKPWNKDTQVEFQCRLIKNRYYRPNLDNITTETLKDALMDLLHTLTLEEATLIFTEKDYKDPDMRGRTSFDPIEKMGLAGIDENGNIFISDIGKRFLNESIGLSDVMLDYLLKFQYPNPLMKGFHEYNTKPFINTLRLIKYVNEKCKAQGLTEKGISKEEFGIFALSIIDYKDVERVADDLIKFRIDLEAITDYTKKQDFIKNYINEYLKDFVNPQKNVYEYADNIIRCIRLTNYIYLRGNGYYIDLEPRRMIEINSILDDLTGEALEFTEKEYKEFIGTYGSYKLPFETLDSLTTIAKNIIVEIKDLSTKLGKKYTPIELGTTIDDVKHQIDQLRADRQALQNECIKLLYNTDTKLEETKFSLTHLKKLTLKPSIELEKWVSISLNILDDAKLIKPNSIMGDDNEPTYTAPAKVPDIECYYETYQMICEVTMLTDRSQWYNEGEPVQQHLRNFENSHSNLPTYCVFIAPRFHEGTLNTFWNAVKYGYDGINQKIIPLSIVDLIRLLDLKKSSEGGNTELDSNALRNFYDKCTDLENQNKFSEWRSLIQKELDNLENSILSN